MRHKAFLRYIGMLPPDDPDDRIADEEAALVALRAQEQWLLDEAWNCRVQIEAGEKRLERWRAEDDD